jgi:hypothetical protein
MRRDMKLAALRSALDQRGLEKGDEVVFFCPKHGASAGRKDGQLSVNLLTDTFNCWSCGYKSRNNLTPLLKIKGMTSICRKYVEELEELRKASILNPAIEAPKLYDQPVLPPEFRSLSVPSKSYFFRRALDYLAERGLRTDDVLRWKLGYAETGYLAGRIVIPSFDETGELNFVVGRSFMGDSLRYKPGGKLCKDIIWNDYMVDWTAPLVITEGPFDAFVAEENVTILQGTILPDSLVRKIVLSGVDVYFAMDADAFKRQLKHIELFLSYGVVCRYVDIRSRGKKDLGAMTKSEFRERKAAAKVVHDEFDILRMRVSA